MTPPKKPKSFLDWRCRVCSTGAAVPGSMKQRADKMLSALIESHKKMSPECKADGCHFPAFEGGYFEFYDTKKEHFDALQVDGAPPHYDHDELAEMGHTGEETEP